MYHSAISGNPTFEAYVERAIMNFVTVMPDGVFLNMHNSKNDSCLGIALLGTGDIVALHSVCSLNPLSYNRESHVVVLSTWSVGGFFRKLYTGWKASVDEYNESLSKFCNDKAIIGYYIYDEYEDNQYKDNNKSDIDDELQNALDQLKKAKQVFEENHAKRIQLLHNTMNECQEKMDDDNSVSKQLDEISKELDDLLKSFD